MSKKITSLKIFIVFSFAFFFLFDVHFDHLYKLVPDSLIDDRDIGTKDAPLCERHANFPSGSWPVCLAPTFGSFLKKFDIVTGYSNEESRYLQERLPVFVKRAEKVSRECLKHPLLQKRRHFPLLWDTAHSPNILYCPILKVASGTWIGNFLRLAHFNEDNKELEKLPQEKRNIEKYRDKYGWNHKSAFKIYKEPRSQEERSQIFKQALRFLVVRHPFTRLLSSFRAKIEIRNPRMIGEEKYRKIRKEIQKSKRKKTRKTPEFSDFADYLISKTEHLQSANDWIATLPNTLIPYWVRCNVCGSDYAIMMKLETLQEDEKFLAILAGLREISEAKDRSSMTFHRLFNKNSTEVLRDYYGKLSKKQILLLYERYKLDFELFDYSVSEYLLYAKN